MPRPPPSRAPAKSFAAWTSCCSDCGKRAGARVGPGAVGMNPDGALGPDRWLHLLPNPVPHGRESGYAGNGGSNGHTTPDVPHVLAPARPRRVQHFETPRDGAPELSGIP